VLTERGRHARTTVYDECVGKSATTPLAAWRVSAVPRLGIAFPPNPTSFFVCPLSQLTFLPPPGTMQPEDVVQLAPLLAASTPADDGSSRVYSVSLLKGGSAAASVEALRKSLSGCSVSKFFRSSAP